VRALQFHKVEAFAIREYFAFGQTVVSDLCVAKDLRGARRHQLEGNGQQE